MTPSAPSTLQARRRRWIYAPLLFGLLGSGFGHGSVVAALWLRHLGGAAGGGDNGRGGAGDTTVDVSLAGPASTATTPAPAVPEPAKPSPPPPPKVHEQKPPPPPLPKPDPKDAVEPLPVPEETPPPVAVSPPAVGGGAEETHSGRLPGPTRFGVLGLGGDTVEGQRALLPRAATCKDPVAGRWEALKFNPDRSDWVHFTLAVHRGVGGAITGTILSHTWSGGVFDRDPPGCTLGGFDMTVSMNAIGHSGSDGRITFGSSRYSVVAIKCVRLDNAYAPDNFSGTIDPARQEFQSVNNDGANDINAPYVFRRTGCLDE